MRDPGSAKPQTSSAPIASAWLRVLLIFLVIEKVIQHIVVTVALAVDLGGIRASLAYDFRFFLVAGAVEALLFALGGWGILNAKAWARWLLVALALVDIIGEFVAQGTLLITITVSFLVAVILLGVSLTYRPTKR